MVDMSSSPAETKKSVELPVSKQTCEIRRISWGERLELDDRCTNQITGKIDWRSLHALLADRSTDGVINTKAYFELDPTDGYVLRKEVLMINSIDPAFLETSSDSPKDSTSEPSSKPAT